MRNSIKPYRIWIFLAIILAGVVFFGSSLVGSDEVVEKDGVLYFPDGNPVRNYEQLYIYENSR